MKVKVTIEGKEHEVELDDAVYLTRESHKAILEHTIEDRLARQAKSVRETLEKDDEFFAKLATARGLDPKAKGGTKKELDGELAERLTTELRQREVTPLEERVKAATAELEELRSGMVVAQLTTALIDSGVMKSVAPRIAQLEASRFGYDPKTRTFAMRDGDSFAISTKATREAPYKGLSEFAEEWAGAKENAPFREKAASNGPGVGGAPRQGSAPVARRSEVKSEAEKVKIIGEIGFAAWQALPE